MYPTALLQLSFPCVAHLCDINSVEQNSEVQVSDTTGDATSTKACLIKQGT
jgi:hypothetical protein